MLMKQLKNYTEEAILAFIDKEYPKTDICQCENCRLDVTALVLNEFKQHYVVTERGALFVQMDKDFDPQHRIDLLSSMANAVRIVKSRPRHE